MGKNRPVCHGKPHAGPLAYGFRGKERLEYTGFDGRVNSGTGILHPDCTQFPAGIQLHLRRRIELNSHRMRFTDADRKNLFLGIGVRLHCVFGVDHQVEKRLLKLNRIAADNILPPVVNDAERDAGLGPRKKEFRTFIHQHTDIHIHVLIVALSRKTEHLGGQRPGKLGDMVDLVQIAPDIFVLHFMHVFDDIEMPLNRMDVIVEVMSDSSGEIASSR